MRKLRQRHLISYGVVLCGGVIVSLVLWHTRQLSARLLQQSPREATMRAHRAMPATRRRGTVASEAPPAMPADAPTHKSNRLIHEKSPYLLQHAHNPVDWYPWGPEAFERAKREDKPIFLSIGYSTCYWCHVMEQESFENPEMAKLINALSVPIKVDREERPDLDALYMNAVMAMSGQGGWPMTVFLTPEGKPFWGGTYFPPEDRMGRPGLNSVLQSIDRAWKTRRTELLASSQAITQALQAAHGPRSKTPLTIEAIHTAIRQYARQYDPTHGGFGSAPKFPRSHSLSLLLRAWYRTNDAKILQMVEATLEAMAHGGLHDQLGGGFHRYSTDERWLVPHFEKMLYDQALLARTYLEAYQVTEKSAYADVARDIFEYVLRDLRDPQGTFYAAEDAGEVGKEGEFYVWTPAQLEQVLGAKDAVLVSRYYGITLEGNFEHGASILHVETTMESLAKDQGLTVDEAGARLKAARQQLLAARNQRKRPHRDDKILTDWNGLMIGALAYGGRVLHEPRYTQAAEQAAIFLLERLQREGHLLHRYRDGQADIPAFLDDYAFLAWGLFDLYEATFDVRWLEQGQQLVQDMVRAFWDEAGGGGFFLSGARNERLIATTKELYDGAIPSGNSVAALDLIRYGQLLMDQALQRRAETLFQAFAGQVTQAPHAFPQCLIALDHWLGPSQEIVIAGDPTAASTKEMLSLVARRFLPRATLVLHPTDHHAQAVERLIPFVKNQQPIAGAPTAYICQNYVCQLPTTDLRKIDELLSALPQ